MSVHAFENEHDCAIGFGEREERLVPQPPEIAGLISAPE
jgi:hypothetical protein